MFRMRVFVLATACLPLGAALLMSGPPVWAQLNPSGAPPMAVITDTPEYCQKLLTRISELIRVAATPVPHEATDLTKEGRRMCDHGQTRGGIMRLRSALMLMERDDGPAFR